MIDAPSVDVWRIALDAPLTNDQTLSADERARAARFLAEGDRRRYVAAHVGLRTILARYVERKPQALTFRVNEYGKPALAMMTNVEFNLAHSGECALVAVTRGMPVGVDVEWLRADFEGNELARRFFAPREIELLAAEPGRFFEIWTRKESFLKAIGMGVSFPLPQCDVSEGWVQFEREVSVRIKYLWFVTTFYLDGGYVGAVALPDKDVMVRHYEWTP